MEYAVSPRTRKIKKKLKASTPSMSKRSERFLPALSDLSPRNTPISALIASRKNREHYRQNRTGSPKGNKQRLKHLQREKVRPSHKRIRKSDAKRPKKKKCAQAGLLGHSPITKAQSHSINDATSSELFTERSLSKPLTADRKTLPFLSDKNNISSTSEEVNWAKPRNSECTGDNHVSSSLPNIEFEDHSERDLKQLIEMLQVEMRRYPAAIERQSGVSLRYDNEDITQSSHSMEQQTVLERLQSTISKYHALVSNITHQVLGIASRSQESQELSNKAIQVANSTIDQKNSLIANLVRKQMQDAEELTKVTNSLISSSGQDFEREAQLISAKSSSDKSKMVCLKERHKTRINNLEVKLQSRNFELEQLHREFSHVNERMEMMSQKQINPKQKKSLSNIEQVCIDAEKINKRVERKVMRSLIRYVDCVDQKITPGGQSCISLLREKKEECVTQELLLSRDEGLLKKELVKLTTISQSNSGLNLTEESLLLNTMDDIVEVCDLLINCIQAVGKRTMNYQREIMSIQRNQITSHVEESGEVENYTGISSPINTKGQQSLLIVPVSSEVNQQSNNAHKLSISGEGCREGCEQIVLGPTRVDKRTDGISNSFHSSLPMQLSPVREIGEAEERPLTISERGAKGECFVPSVKLKYTNSSVSRQESLVRSLKFDRPLNSHSHLEFNENSDKGAKTIDKKNASNALVTTKPSIINNKDSKFSTQGQRTMFDFEASNKKGEDFKYPVRTTTEVAKVSRASTKQDTASHVTIEQINKSSTGPILSNIKDRWGNDIDTFAPKLDCVSQLSSKELLKTVNINSAIEFSKIKDSNIAHSQLPNSGTSIELTKEQFYTGHSWTRKEQPGVEKKASYVSQDSVGRPPITKHHTTSNRYSPEEYRYVDLSDLLGNCRKVYAPDFTSPHLQICLQNIVPGAEAKSWKNDEVLSGSKSNTKNKILIKQATKKSDRFRRLSIKMDREDYQPKGSPWIDRNLKAKKGVRVPNSSSSLKFNPAREFRMVPSKGEGRSIDSRKHTADGVNLSTAVKRINRCNAQLSLKTQKLKSRRNSTTRAHNKRRFSIHRGLLTKETAKVDFNYANLLYSQLSEFHCLLSEDDEEIRLVIAVSRAKVLLKKLHDQVNNNVAKEFSLLSELIFHQLPDFTALISEEDEDSNIIIGAARGKVLKLINQKLIVNSPQRRTREPRLSISYTYKKQDRIPINLANDALYTSPFKSKPLFMYRNKHLRASSSKANIYEVDQDAKSTKSEYSFL